MGGFIAGALGGFADEGTNMKGKGKRGLLRGRKKKLPLTRPNESNTTDISPDVPSFKKGGRVKKTGIYKLHKNERVVPAGKARATIANSGHRSTHSDYSKAQRKKKAKRTAKRR